jgi:hypothetical protein
MPAGHLLYIKMNAIPSTNLLKNSAGRYAHLPDLLSKSRAVPGKTIAEHNSVFCSHPTRDTNDPALSPISNSHSAIDHRESL